MWKFPCSHSHTLRGISHIKQVWLWVCGAWVSVYPACLSVVVHHSSHIITPLSTWLRKKRGFESLPWSNDQTVHYNKEKLILFLFSRNKVITTTFVLFSRTDCPSEEMHGCLGFPCNYSITPDVGKEKEIGVQEIEKYTTESEIPADAVESVYLNASQESECNCLLAVWPHSPHVLKHTQRWVQKPSKLESK